MNNIFLVKMKYNDDIKIDIKNIIKNDDYNDNDKYKYDLRITNYCITKKIDKNIYITYYNIKYIIKNVNINAIRRHEICNSKYIICYIFFYNSKYYYYKKYITYYINYYIIIYNDNTKAAQM